MAAPACSTESSDELSVAAGVEAVSLAERASHECRQELPPGVGHAPGMQGTASDVVQAEGIPATAERGGQGQRNGVGNTVDLNDSPDLLLPGEYNHPLFQPNTVHTLPLGFSRSPRPMRQLPHLRSSAGVYEKLRSIASGRSHQGACQLGVASALATHGAFN